MDVVCWVKKIWCLILGEHALLSSDASQDGGHDAGTYIVYFGRFELVNLIWLREVSMNGLVKLWMNVNGEFWKKHICN